MPPGERPLHEPMFNVPAVIVLLIGALLAIHGLRLLIGEQQDLALLVEGAFVPARLTLGLGLDSPADILRALTRPGGSGFELDLARLFLGDGAPRYFTLVSYAFLHGDWLHVGINSIWLLAFGSPVARRFAAMRFLAFFVFCAIAGALVQWLANPDSVQPVIGASGAIAGLMGAALRFMFRDDIRLGPGAEHDTQRPRLSLSQSFRDRRVLGFVLVMLAINMLTALGFQFVGQGHGKIAWQAHIGGFLAGLLAFAAFDPVPADRPDTPRD